MFYLYFKKFSKSCRLLCTVSCLLAILSLLFFAACGDKAAEGSRIKSDKNTGSDTVKNIREDKELLRKINKTKSDLSRWLNRNTRYPSIPSSVAAVIRGDTVVFKKATGTTEHRLYHVASHTKIFTSIALLQLAEKGKLGLDDRVSKYLPVIIERQELGSEPVTIRHLMTHSSGMGTRGKPVQVKLKPPMVITEQLFPAGYQFYYSNSGYNLLGRLVEKVSGMSLGKYVTENIIIPLEMKDAKASDKMRGASGLLLSLNDMINYVKMLINGGVFKGRNIIPEQYFREIFMESVEVPPGKYKEFRGLCWRVWTIDDIPYSLNHASLSFGSGGWVQVYPSMKVGYLFMSNTPNFKDPGFDWYYRSLKIRLRRFASLMRGTDYDPAQFKVSVPGKDILPKYAGTYVNPLTGRTVRVQFVRSHLVVRYSYGGYAIWPETGNSFLYIQKKPKLFALRFEFIWKNDAVVGIGAKEGYYARK